MKHLILLKLQNMMDINVDLLQWFINVLIKKLQVVPLCLQINLLLKMKICQTKELAEEFYKPIIIKSKKGKAHSTFIDNILGADLADMQSISKFNKKIRFYYVLLTFSVNTYGLFL